MRKAILLLVTMGAAVLVAGGVALAGVTKTCPTSTAAPIVTNSKIAFLIPSVLSLAFAAVSLAEASDVC